MSDLGRKDFDDKLKSKVKPNSEKSNLENAKDHVTDKLDSMAGKGTREEDKSLAQKASDAIFGDK